MIDALLDRCTFPPAGVEVALGVSGGADSAAMMILAVAAGCSVTGIHLDHGLREGGAGEARRVAELADRLGAGFERRHVSVETGPNLQARARELRLAELGDETLLGHTSDDQAETILLSLGRGAGIKGLAGMTARRHPILGLRRSETEQVCIEFGYEPLMDPSNLDPRHRRVRVRTEVVPLLDEVFGRDVVEVMSRQAPLLDEVVDLLDALASDVDVTDARQLSEAHPAVARWAVRAWLTERSAVGQPPDAASVERVLRVARGEIVGTEAVGGTHVSRSKGRLSAVPRGQEGGVGVTHR